jgi:cyclic beta-1,2-glucan synthetase
VAHRTSPTNIGLLLLSTLAAHDFGYLGWDGLLDRLEKTLDTSERLERFRGHFYNWYDTTTLAVLQPAYVSTVDSGNLLACLITLKQGLLEKTREPSLGPSLPDGLDDTVRLAVPAARTMVANTPAPTKQRQVIDNLERAWAELRQQTPDGLLGWVDWLKRADEQARALAEVVEEANDGSAAAAAAVVWAGRLVKQIKASLEEQDQLTPWQRLLVEPEADSCRIALAGGGLDAEWTELQRRLTASLSLVELAEQRETWHQELVALETQLVTDGAPRRWLHRLSEAVEAARATEWLDRCRRLMERAEVLAAAMQFGFLFQPDRQLFVIGYNVAAGRSDSACYDLLASEARLTCFLAVARGDAPPRLWFLLGRLVTAVGRRLCLLSWGGTMFEYLMPELLLRRFPGTLLAESAVAAVARQMEYGRQRGVPWGISESAFSSQYINLDFQYQAFGVPGLGLKRGLGRDLVIAPYATALAAMIRPHEALRNLRRLAALGGEGCYGFYESLDFTRDRLPECKDHLVVRCFMAHHQGMSFLALANCLFNNPMPRRFHQEPMVRATELLLEERVPTIDHPTQPTELDAEVAPAGADSALSRRITTPFTAFPRTHLLANGRYSMMLTNAGGGFSRCEGLDVTRWREDVTGDAWGQFLYLRDLTTGVLWSAGYQPTGRRADAYEVLYSVDKAEIRRRDGHINSHLEITVCPENCAEMRRVMLTNQDTRPHDVELTSYLEVVLAPHAADLAHPAFGKLFLETEWVAEHQALLCRRRPRSQTEAPVWAVHVAGGACEQERPEFETDRARFLGRGRSPANPVALEPGARLSGTTGPVLDPVLSLRRRVRLEPGVTAVVTFCTAVARSRPEALALADHYRDPQAAVRVFDLAWAHSRIELRHLRMTTEEVHLFQRLAASLLYTNPTLRSAPQILAANRQGLTGLWRHGISGDYPILLARIDDSEDLPLVRQLLVAHDYLRLKGLVVDLVLLTEEATSYLDELYKHLQETIRASDSAGRADRPGGVFLRKTDQMPPADVLLLQACARVVLLGRRGSLTAQLGKSEPAARPPVALPGIASAAGAAAIELPADLLFANGVGGITPDGREYCILPYTMAAGPYLALPPASWINVLANPSAGCLVSESGLGYSWAFNSQQNRLTPWSNDPIADPPTEVVYLRDEETGAVWTPTPRPRGAATPILVRHGQGYTVFAGCTSGLKQEMWVFVPAGDPLKIISLRLRNVGSSPRRLSATYYAEWVLGTVREQAPLTVRTEIDGAEGALLAYNPFNQDHGHQVAFQDVDLRPRTVTADRTEFLGRNGSTTAPAGMSRSEFVERVGPGLDPCAVVRVVVELAPGEEREIAFFLGSAPDVATARRLLQRHKQPGQVAAALAEVCKFWEDLLTTVQVRTPDPAFDVLVNRWLLYQVLACRVWGRSAFYQSGGAYGFRDQLQDGMALVHAAPAETRAHLLRAAAHQFAEGDVQHWWHPPAGRGVRTRFSDDFLWLPFAVCQYVAVTGDTTVLDEKAPFLHAPLLAPGQEDAYGLPGPADETGTLYDHCVRALRHGLQFGAHGLPLMGAGDWNDGMNRVGIEGRGETVWGGWFLLTTLGHFQELAEARGDTVWAEECRREAARLHQALEANAWDGAWYRRAYFDDGTPLGSAVNDECRIDSLPQTWAVFSGAADPARARQAMDSAYEYLVQPADRLILVFTPPFDDGPLQPGYIKGYVPGIRENGGQYTHAATWVVLATARLGHGDQAWELFDYLNPLRHTDTAAKVARYKIEPYVLAGDVYGAPPHTGRGGWSWYTGSAAWLYRVAIEGILGLERRGDRLIVAPCIPANWSGFTIDYRFGLTIYRIYVKNSSRTETGVPSVIVDGRPCEQPEFRLRDDGRQHDVRVVLP